MSNEQKNMEDFLREKLSHGGEDFTDDWSVFEQKLERATFFKQMRVGAMVSVVLIMLSIGFFGGSSFSKFNVFQNGNYQNEAYRGEGGYSDFDAIKESEPKVETIAETQSLVTTTSKKTEAAPNQVVESETTGEIAYHEVSDVASEEIEVQNTEQAEAAVVGDPVIVSAESVEVDNAKQTLTDNIEEEAESLAPVSEAAVAEAGLSEEMNVASSGLVASRQSGSGGSGQALIPDGLETSNFKPNVKPIELMIDPRDVKSMSLKAPVIPMKITPAKKEAYVSPLQEKNPWSYSIKVYPNFTYRKFTVAANKMQYIHRDFIDQVEVSESGSFSLNVGFEASKRIGRITYLNGGVEYISYKTEANFDFMNYRDAIINSESGKITSYEFRSEPEHIVIVDANRYHYLNLPLSIAYRPWATDHVRLNIEAGASYMYFIKASGKSLDYQTLEVIDLSERDYRNSMASICLKVGASYHVSEQFSLGFEPTVVYFSNTIYTEEYPFEVVPYSVGVNFKLQMKLN